MRQFDAAVRAMMKAKYVSQAGLSRKLGISTAAVSMALGGRIRFPAARMDRLFGVLGLSEVERKQFRLLYLADLAPGSLAGVVDSVRREVLGIDERVAKAAELAERLLYAEEAFDRHLGEKLAGGPKAAYFASVLDRFLEMGLADTRTHTQLRRALESAKAPVDYSRVVGRMLARLIHIIAGVKDASALEKLLTLLNTGYIDHLVEVACDVARRMARQ